MKGKREYLIATNVRRHMPRVKVAIPKVELKPQSTPASMLWITGARNCTVALRSGLSAMVNDICDIATP
jgi:hypothetical protein